MGERSVVMGNLGVGGGEVYSMASAGDCSILPCAGLAQAAVPEVKVKHHPWDPMGWALGAGSDPMVGPWQNPLSPTTPHGWSCVSPVVKTFFALLQLPRLRCCSPGEERGSG